mgnify:CR=1 FL=1
MNIENIIMEKNVNIDVDVEINIEDVKEYINFYATTCEIDDIRDLVEEEDINVNIINDRTLIDEMKTKILLKAHDKYSLNNNLRFSMLYNEMPRVSKEHKYDKYDNHFKSFKLSPNWAMIHTII